MNFIVGQEVVCVSDNWDNPPSVYPIEGIVYKITRIEGELLEFSALLENWGWCELNFHPLGLDYDFVEEVIKQVEPKEEVML